MEYTLPVSLGGVLALVVVGVVGLASSGVMTVQTVVSMVAPSMLGYGLLAFWLGMKHGEFRAGS